MLTGTLGMLAAAALAVRQRRRRSRARADALGPRRKERVDRRREITRVLERALERALVRADVGLAPSEVVAVWLSIAVGAAMVALPVAGPVGAGLVVLAALVGGPVVLIALRHRRDVRLRQAVPELLEDVARELRAGGSVPGALERIRDRPGPLGAETGAVVARVRLGLTLDEALAGWAASFRASAAREAVRTAALALRVAAGAGGRSAGALDGMAAALRDESSALAEARAQAAQGRMSALLLGGLPIASFLFSAVVDGDAIGAALGHPAGRGAVLVGFALDAAGLVWMRRIVRVVP